MPGGIEIKRDLLIFAVIALAVAAVDQATKAAVAHSLSLHQSVEVIPGFFNLVYSRNPGAAFGIFREGGFLRTVFLMGVTVVAVAVIIVIIAKSRDLTSTITLSMVAGGAAGNLVDRIRLGEVVDFLDFHIGPFHWPAFNLADSSITTVVILYIFLSYLKGKKGKAGAE